MNRQSQRGIALVITLLMLSVVTMMAVVFLAISRREKSSVTVTADQTEAKLMADTAVERAKAEIAARMMSFTNAFAYDALVSTNFINPIGFQAGVTGPTNVSYVYPNSTNPVSGLNDTLQLMANLQYDPRPPVYITDESGKTDFRFYLDFNRNGRFDTNGLLPVQGNNPNQYYDTNGVLVTGKEGHTILYENFIGDPEWIGVLDRPTLPHSDTNRFLGRYAYLVLPAGKSLDINFIHNNAKNDDIALTGGNNFYRNQGVGSWELNLAGFLRDLNTNAWGGGYVYRGGNAGGVSTGFPFDDARTILQFRYLDPNAAVKVRRLNLLSLFSAHGAVFLNDGVDTMSDGPFYGVTSPRNVDVGPFKDNLNKQWSGSPNPQAIYDPQEFFNTNLVSDFIQRSRDFVTRLTSLTTNRDNSYDRYTVYRMLEQLGTDSKPAVSNRLFQSDFHYVPVKRLNLNYRNDALLAKYQNGSGFYNPETALTNYFIPWDPETPTNRTDLASIPSIALIQANNPRDFFLQAADRLIRASLATNMFLNTVSKKMVTNFFLGATPINDTFSVTNILLFSDPTEINKGFWETNNEYTSTLHRLLQVALNTYDSVTRRSLGTTNDYPTVMRPVFGKKRNNIYIVDWKEVLTSAEAVSPTNRWWDLSVKADRDQIRSFDHIYGVPWIIGAKKGYPNFNEFSLETIAQASRRLLLTRTSTGAKLTTNQLYSLSISNIFGVEAWNSYTNDYKRPYKMYVSHQYGLGLSARSEITGFETPLLTNSGTYTNFISTNIWPGTHRASVPNPNPTSFQLPIRANHIFFGDTNYLTVQQRFTNLTIFEPGFQVPLWNLHVTNRLQYILVDADRDRIIDFVNLDRMMSQIDIAKRLMGDQQSKSNTPPIASAGRKPGGNQGGGAQAATIGDDDLWITNHIAGGLGSPTFGITNQIGVSAGVPYIGEGMWRSGTGDPTSGQDKPKSIQEFRQFLLGGGTNLFMQAPFSPTRKIWDHKSWQANDPLVHYTVEDLTDLLATDPNNTQNYRTVVPANNPLPQSNLGLLNELYRPWGDAPGKTPSTSSKLMAIKDPGIKSSDDWDFGAGTKLANVGWIGRVHRGTPWQTLYLKRDATIAGAESMANWTNRWSLNIAKHPTNDWKFLDLFTVAPNDAAARGLLSVNQTNLAAWSAVLSGVATISNQVKIAGAPLTDAFINPSSRELRLIVDGINRARAQQPRQTFQTLGDVLSAPELTTLSPYLTNLVNSPNITDEVVERIPRQIMSLLKTDEPRIVIYAFGQSLKPADRSVVTFGNFFNICTNYQITGEVFTKTVIRFENVPFNPTPVVESFTVLPPQ